MEPKILFLLHLPPPVHGSAVMGKQIYDSAAIRKDFNCRFLNINTSSSGDKIGRLDFRKLFVFAGILWRTFLNMVFWKPDLVYFGITVTRGGFFKDFLVVCLLKIFRVNIVYHLHNKGVSEHREMRPYSWSYPFVFREVSCILLSKRLSADIAHYIPEERIYICPNGIKDSFTNNGGEVTRRDEPRRILFLSNLFESKGVYVLLDACMILMQRKIEFFCEFVGGEGDLSENDFQIYCKENGLQEHVIYSGKRYGEEKCQCLASADIFAFPTYNETFGLVNLEAMQWSLPIVSTNEGGIPDVVLDGESGFVVAKLDATALADKLELLICNPELRQRMGAAGRAHYLNSFTDEQFEETMCSILKDIISDACNQTVS